MFSPKNMIVCMVVTLLGSSGLAEGAPKVYPSTECRPGIGGPCVPKRITYGYTPTTWRRWPTDPETNTPKAEPENLPTPAKEPLPNAEPEGPTLVPEEPSQAPANGEPTIPKSDEAPPFAPPFEDTAPAPPKELSKPIEEKKADAPPERPADAKPPTDSAAPPSPPEDDLFKEDPFKDDPFKDEPPAPEPNRGARKNRLRSAPARPSVTSWHSTGKKPAILAQDSQARPLSPSEPRRLQVVSNDSEGEAAAPPIGVATKINPLRPADPQTRDVGVIPTAGWSAQDSSTNATAAPLRRNPLRPD